MVLFKLLTKVSVSSIIHYCSGGVYSYFHNYYVLKFHGISINVIHVDNALLVKYRAMNDARI